MSNSASNNSESDKQTSPSPKASSYLDEDESIGNRWDFLLGLDSNGKPLPGCWETIETTDNTETTGTVD